MEIDLDDLYEIAESAPLLAQVETVLREKGLDHTANDLLKLQQDCGEQISRNFEEPGEVAPGPLSAALDNQYTPLTRERLDKTFQTVRQALPVDLQAPMADLMKNLNITEPDVSSSGKNNNPRL